MLSPLSPMHVDDTMTCTGERGGAQGTRRLPARSPRRGPCELQARHSGGGSGSRAPASGRVSAGTAGHASAPCRTSRPWARTWAPWARERGSQPGRQYPPRRRGTAARAPGADAGADARGGGVDAASRSFSAIRTAAARAAAAAAATAAPQRGPCGARRTRRLRPAPSRPQRRVPLQYQSRVERRSATRGCEAGWPAWPRAAAAAAAADGREEARGREGRASILRQI